MLNAALGCRDAWSETPSPECGPIGNDPVHLIAQGGRIAQS